ncbi:MAG: Trk family potassium uptake protein [Chloroflexi bacterium]|nr:Trk family potassium uptake protein [Chloroflexota bacterium]
MQQRQPPKLGERVFRVPIVEPWRIPLSIVRAPRFRSLPITLVVYAFAIIIGVGAVLLMLPISSESGQSTPFIDALFTATSAVCVTGLAVVDTGTHYSLFGEGVIMALMQIGGFGIMTGGTFLLVTLGRRVGLREKLIVGESMGLDRLGGLVPLVMGIMVFTIVAEGLGMVMFYIRFSSEYSPTAAAWTSAFHAVSAFNNAGLDIFGVDAAGNSLSLAGYQNDPLVVLTTAGLIVLGGISFIVVLDVFRIRRFSRLAVDSKLVLFTTGVLLAVGMIVILAMEYNNPATLGPMTWPQKVLDAFFHSVTPRTAGFFVVSIPSMAVYTLFFIIMLMYIGGASGSTAGGIKVNTFGMLAATVWSTIRGKEYPGAFGREFKAQQIHRALTIVMLSIGLVGVVALVLVITEDAPFIDVLFETVSAFGTVGLSTGITDGLTVAGKAIIVMTMFVGRLGPLTLAFSLVQRQQRTVYRYPQEDVRIG